MSQDCLSPPMISEIYDGQTCSQVFSISSYWFFFSKIVYTMQ